MAESDVNNAGQTLPGEWEIKDYAPNEVSAAELLTGGDGWISASAPGDTYLALYEAGRISHPFAEQNESACAWVKDREWWWRSRFPAMKPGPNERVMLTFEGLDTYASIWLNGGLLGKTDNMFAAFSFDAGPLLRDDEPNLLLICFTPPALRVADKSMATWDIIADPIKESKRNFHRKAQFGWGWDWGPQLPSVGIWRPVRLERQRIAAIRDVRFTTLVIEPAAVIDVAVTIDAFAAEGDSRGPLRAVIQLLDPAGVQVAGTTLTFDGASRSTACQLTVDTPSLWWTPELGLPSLYTLRVELAHGEQTLDQRTLKVGIRSIELDTSADLDEPGCDFFRFLLNGVPIFARGVNWIPASSFVGATTASDHETLLKEAATVNVNMVRVWGGGLYETDAFYDACDRLGLLVWQDFMFACAPYPEDEPAFVESVQREVDYQITRLRNHPSLALWCGNNEGQAVHQFMSRMTGVNTPYPGDLFFQRMIPQALKALDPATPYWPGSPYGGPSHNSMRAGDVHNWTVWHGLPPVPDAEPVGTFDHSPEAVAYTRYAEDKARFVSEFGIQAAPAESTLARWIAPDQMTLGSEGFLNRIKDHPQDKVNAMLIPVTGLPATLRQYVTFTQLVQAEGLKFGIEHYRRRKPHCSGTLIWQYNDCWPGISWSLIDYDRVRKASWYYVARAYAPVLGSFKTLDDGTVELWVTNDTRADVEFDATLTMMTFDGATLWQETMAGTVPATGSRAVWRSSLDRPGAAPDRVLTVRSSKFADNRLFFAPIKTLPFAAMEPRMDVQAGDDGALSVTLTGIGYHHFVHLLAADAHATFSDNYFDLQPGETRTVRVAAGGVMLTPASVSLGSFHR
ncbi:beta-mannosidase [Paraburkholderia sp. D1E]|uniref:beta-mannosidase n=1 Tax=Paraburkholderia sp. D1E TaxID=3461398 RepID=UPI0040454D22